MDFHAIELFAGVGMLGEGLRAGLGYLGIQNRTVCYVEREAYAAAVLAARIQEGSLDAAPVWSDVCTFNARRWAGAVDCVVAGFPCQDLSVAGQRAGLDGARSGLFFEVLRIARDCGAEWLFLDNVAGIATATATAVDEAEGALEERSRPSRGRAGRPRVGFGVDCYSRVRRGCQSWAGAVVLSRMAHGPRRTATPAPTATGRWGRTFGNGRRPGQRRQAEIFAHPTAGR